MNTSCKNARAIIDDVGDMLRLPPEISRHIDACAACREFGLDLEALRSLLREPGRVKAPETFDADLARRLRAVKPSKPARWHVRTLFSQPVLSAAAAIALVASASLAVFRSLPDTQDLAPNITMNAAIPGASTETVTTDETTTASALDDTMNEIVPPPVPPRRDPARVRSSSGVKRGARREAMDTMMLVRDELGTRVVSVPVVLVGSERILPVTDSVSRTQTEVVSF